jgi:hypothetical protein
MPVRRRGGDDTAPPDDDALVLGECEGVRECPSTTAACCASRKAVRPSGVLGKEEGGREGAGRLMAWARVRVLV